MADQQKFTFKLSKKYTPEQRLAIGQEVIEFIIKRSKSGKDKDNIPFASYSEGYMKSFDFKKSGKGKKPNLTLSGEMLRALEVLESSEGEVTIGIPENDTFNNEKAEGNILGTYGSKSPNKKKARDFMGIKPKDLNAIKSDYPIRTKAERENSLTKALELLGATEAGEDLINNFLDIGEA